MKNEEIINNSHCSKSKCVFCKGTGIVKYLDLNMDILDGSYDLNKMIENKGIFTTCPEGCMVMN